MAEKDLYKTGYEPPLEKIMKEQKDIESYERSPVSKSLKYKLDNKIDEIFYKRRDYRNDTMVDLKSHSEIEDISNLLWKEAASHIAENYFGVKGDEIIKNLEEKRHYWEPKIRDYLGMNKEELTEIVKDILTKRDEDGNVIYNPVTRNDLLECAKAIYDEHLNAMTSKMDERRKRELEEDGYLSQLEQQLGEQAPTKNYKKA